MAGDLRVSEQHGYAVLQYVPSLQIRVPVTFAQSVGDGYASIRVNVTFLQATVDGYPNVRSNASIVQAGAEGYPNVRSNYVVFQSVIPVGDVPVIPTHTLPGFGNGTAPMLGLAFNVHKKPMFNTRVSESVSFNSVRSMLADYPRWDYSLTFDYLEDRSGAESALKRLMGAFLNAGGKAKPFMFEDPDDHTAVMAEIGVSDSVTLQYDVLRQFGGFSEPVGMVNTGASFTLYFGVTETSPVPSLPGPYTITVAHAADFVQDDGVKIGTTPLTKVTGAPGPMEYAVAAGVYTFNSAQHDASVSITYRYTASPALYSITNLNKLLFVSAPSSGKTIYASYSFFFTCFFNDDVVDFEKFMHQLWQLQTMSFHSELLA